MYGYDNFYYNQKHKVFISFYHHDDQKYKDTLEYLFGNTVINKSVSNGEYNTDISDEYVKRLIREDKISDASVVVVLVGPNTKNRKHVDWEIYAGLSRYINGNAGLIGVLLPTFPLYSGKYYYQDIPARLADNIKTGYADIYTWDDFTSNYSSYIQEAFDNRSKRRSMIDNSRLQMKQNKW